MTKGKFIVIEGIDGSGTSTQSRMLKDKLEDSGISVYETREPSDGPVGVMIRSALTRRLNFAKGKKHFDRQLAFLYAADRQDHLYNPVDGIVTLLKQGTHVICTRYVFSSLAYNCDDASRKFVASLNSQFPDPDLVIYLNGDVTSSMARMEGTRIRDLHENEDKLTQVSRNYDRIWVDYKGLIVQVDAQQAPEDISNMIFTHVLDLLAN